MPLSPDRRLARFAYNVLSAAAIFTTAFIAPERDQTTYRGPKLVVAQSCETDPAKDWRFGVYFRDDMNVNGRGVSLMVALEGSRSSPIGNYRSNDNSPTTFNRILPLRKAQPELGLSGILEGHILDFSVYAAEGDQAKIAGQTLRVGICDLGFQS